MIDYKLIIGLVCVMLANVLFGSSLAKIQEEFNKKTFWNGVYKVAMIVVGSIALCITAYLNQDIILVSINGTNMNMKDAINTLLIAGITLYGAMDLKKVAQLIGVSTRVEDKTDTPTVQVPQENVIERND